jgi:hypothetical protein
MKGREQEWMAKHELSGENFDPSKFVLSPHLLLSLVRRYLFKMYSSISLLKIIPFFSFSILLLCFLTPNI